MLHHQLINVHYHVRYKGLAPWDVLHAAITSLLILLNKTLCRCSIFTSRWGWGGGGDFKVFRVMSIQKRHPEIQKRQCSMNLSGKWLQVDLQWQKLDLLHTIRRGGLPFWGRNVFSKRLFLELFYPSGCITKHFRTTSTQWKQTASSTDVITRISAPPPPSAAPLWPAHSSNAGKRKRQRGGRVRLAPSFPAVLQQTQIGSHGRVAADSSGCTVALGTTAKMIKLMFQHAKKHPGVGWIKLSVHLSDCYWWLTTI